MGVKETRGRRRREKKRRVMGEEEGTEMVEMEVPGAGEHPQVLFTQVVLHTSHKWHH